MSFIIANKTVQSTVESPPKERLGEPIQPVAQPASRHPLFDRFAEVFDRYLEPNVETFVPAVAPLSVASRPILDAAQVATLLKIEEQVARLRHWLDTKAFDLLRKEVADLAKVDPETLVSVDPAKVLETGLRVINSGASSGGSIPTATVWVQFPGAQCNTLCVVQTKFAPDRLELSLFRAGAEDLPVGPALRDFPVRYDQFPGDPIRRVINAKNRAQTSAPGKGSAKTRSRNEKRRRKAEREQRETARQPPTSRAYEPQG